MTPQAVDNGRDGDLGDTRHGPTPLKPHRKIEATYRGAKAEDRDAILELLKEMHKEVSIYAIDEEKVVEKIDSIIGNGVCFLAVVDDEIVGSLGCEPCQTWYSGDVYLGERWTFVKEDFRRSTIAKDLLKMVDDFSAKMDMVLVIGVFSPRHTAGKNALFRRTFKPMGEFFIGGKHNVL
jgi:hypothetical protein|tara:strand:+ start:570 stop:1106 length:537 start_codon:yes stop_codon:yes gene_type:complete